MRSNRLVSASLRVKSSTSCCDRCALSRRVCAFWSRKSSIRLKPCATEAISAGPERLARAALSPAAAFAAVLARFEIECASRLVASRDSAATVISSARMRPSEIAAWRRGAARMASERRPAKAIHSVSGIGLTAQTRSNPCTPAETNTASPARMTSEKMRSLLTSRPTHFSGSGERSTSLPVFSITPRAESAGRTLSGPFVEPHRSSSMAVETIPLISPPAPGMGTAAVDTQRPRIGPWRTLPNANGLPAITA